MPKAATAHTNPIDWFSLGFEATPFSNTATSEQLFFKSQALINTLNRLCTLDTSDVCITTLIGEKGSGKSTCLKTLNKTRSHYQSKILQGSRGLNPQNLIKAIFGESRKGVHISRQPSTEECITILKTLTSQSKQIRVLVDQAQELPPSTLALIKKITCIQPNGSQLQFVLCANKAQDLEALTGDAQLKTQSVQLHNLTRKETEKFVTLKLQGGRNQPRTHTLPKEYLDNLFQRTRGNLYKINEDAAATLPAELSPPAQPQEKTDTTVPPNKIMTLAAIPLMALALMILPKAILSQRQASPIKAKISAPTLNYTKPSQVSKLIYILNQPSTKSAPR